MGSQQVAPGPAPTPDVMVEEAAPWEVRLNVFNAALDAAPQHSRLHGIHTLKVPEETRNENPEAYVPRDLFLGFLNRSDPEQQLGWDNHKAAWARQFLAWKAHATSSTPGPGPGSTIPSYSEQWQQFVESLDVNVEHAYQFYGIQAPYGIKAETVKSVLALDALFLGLLLCDWREPDGGILPNDFFGVGKVVQRLEFGNFGDAFRDMFVFENQVPLNVLRSVIYGFPPSSRTYPLRVDPSWNAVSVEHLFEYLIQEVLVDRYCDLFPEASEKENCKKVHEAIKDHVRLDGDESSHHLLHCLVQLISHTPGDRTEYNQEGGRIGIISVKSASQLNKVGIRFTGSGPIFIHQMSFHNSRLLLPRISFHDDTEALLRNLVACEQSTTTIGQRTQLVGYLALMNNLIHTGEDVQLLVEFKVLNNQLGSEDEAAVTWNKLLKNVSLDQSKFLCDIIMHVNRRFDEPLPKLWEELKKIYFSRPWFTVSFLAAFVLLGLTVVQTIYSILAYKKQ